LTCTGFSIEGAGAFAWADSEIYLHKEPNGHISKLDVSPAGFVGGGAGYASILRDYVAAVKTLREPGLWQAGEKLARMLQNMAARKRGRFEEWGLEYDNSTTCFLLGFDGEKVCGYVLDERFGWEPRMAPRFTSPLAFGALRTAHDVLSAAEAQLQRIRQFAPKASGGRLQIAKIGRNRVARLDIHFGGACAAA
jgi:hypothetical protein